MEFNYPSLETVDISGKRFYQIDDKTFYPSITTILGNTQSEETKIALEGWKNWLGKDKAKEETKRAADRGTVVHKLIERFLKGETINESVVSFTDMQMFNSLKLKLKAINKIYGQEVVLHSGMMKVAGRCDFIGEYEGTPVIADWKTSTNLKGLDRVQDYFLQGCFYGIAHNEMFDTSIQDVLIFVAAERGLPQLFRTKITEEYTDKLMDRIEKFYKEL
jgi:hypothetical protein